jgi:hypothetical protein
VEFGAGGFAPHLETWGFRLADGDLLPAGAVSGRVVTLRVAGGAVYKGARVTGYQWGPGQPGILVVAGGTLTRHGAGRQAMGAPAVVPIAAVESGRVHQPDGPDEEEERQSRA